MLDYKARVEKSADFLRQKVQHAPKVGIVLGTGLGGLVSLKSLTATRSPTRVFRAFRSRPLRGTPERSISDALAMFR